MTTQRKAYSLGTDLLRQHGLAQDGWTIGFDRATKRFGACWYNRKTITLSSALLPHRDDDAVLQTLLHEVAHALTPGANHGPVWLRKAREIGYTGDRCSDEREAVEAAGAGSRYVSKCTHCDIALPRTKAPKPGGFWRHKGCPGKITFVLRTSAPLRMAAQR